MKISYLFLIGAAVMGCISSAQAQARYSVSQAQQYQVIMNQIPLVQGRNLRVCTGYVGALNCVISDISDEGGLGYLQGVFPAQYAEYICEEEAARELISVRFSGNIYNPARVIYCN